MQQEREVAMLISALTAIHVLGVVIWIGGVAFVTFGRFCGFRLRCALDLKL